MKNPALNKHWSENSVSFLHYFDIHFLELKSADRYEDIIKGEALLATKMAILCTDEILISAASYFESRLCQEIVIGLSEIYERGQLWLVGSAANIDEFILKKLDQYDVSSNQHQAYLNTLKKVKSDCLPPFRTRFRSATNDIQEFWKYYLTDNSLVNNLARGTKFKIPSDFEAKWERVPEQLENRAFIVDYVAPILLEDNLHPTILNRLHYLINEAYFSSYVEEFSACTISDLIYLASPHSVPSSGKSIPYRRVVNAAISLNFLDKIKNSNGEELLKFREDERWLNFIGAEIQRDSDIVSPQKQKHINQEKKTMELLRAFIVHGHDGEIKLALKDYLQNTLSLPEPTILHQKPNSGLTIIEKFEKYAHEIDVAFILLSPDDIGGVDDESLRERVRQNVIFELGYFIGNFGRKSGRVILLYKGTLEVPSDLSGVTYIDITHGIESAGEQIRNELTQISAS